MSFISKKFSKIATTLVLTLIFIVIFWSTVTILSSRQGISNLPSLGSSADKLAQPQQTYKVKEKKLEINNLKISKYHHQISPKACAQAFKAREKIRELPVFLSSYKNDIKQRQRGKDLCQNKSLLNWSSNHAHLNKGQSQEKVFFGLLHSHTNHSDGVLSPEENVMINRILGKLDFMALTDHANFWLNDQMAVWKHQEHISEFLSDSSFVFLRGFEYSHVVNGHYIVLNTTNFRSSSKDLTLSQFYQWLSSEPQSTDSIVFFAHPGFHRYRSVTEFEHFRLDSRIKKNIVGLEVFHWEENQAIKKGFQSKSTFFDEALLRGWNVGAIASQDNHDPYVISNDSKRIGLILNNLSKADIIDALRKRRFYATYSPSLQLSTTIQDKNNRAHSMGSSLQLRDLPKQVTAEIQAFNEDKLEQISQVELVINGQVRQILKKARVQSQALEGYSVTFPRTIFERQGRNFFYFRIYLGQRETPTAITSPFTIEGKLQSLSVYGAKPPRVTQ